MNNQPPSNVQLDAAPDNELGKGILPPATEAKLIADGYIYARRVTSPRGFVSLATCKRPIEDAMRDIMQSAYDILSQKKAEHQKKRPE